MVKRYVCTALIAVLAVAALTGCTVVKIGEEDSLTGNVEFSAGDSVDSIWDSALIPECEEKAIDAAEILDLANGDLTSLGESCDGYKSSSAASYNYCVRIESATVTEVDKDSFYGTATLSVPDYDGNIKVTLQLGQYKGSSVRDDLSFISFEDFTNQTEWGQINTSILEKIDEEVVQPVYEEVQTGATVNVVGCFTGDTADEMLVTPVVLTME